VSHESPASIRLVEPVELPLAFSDLEAEDLVTKSNDDGGERYAVGS
jgi:hypothetical protein